MESMHSLLKRQLKRHLGAAFSIPPEWQAFINGVNEAYRDFDADRAMLEHSLELSSQELLEANSEMRAVFQAIPDLVFRLDHQGMVLDVKAGASGELAIGRRDLLGKRLQDTPLKDVAPQFAGAIQRVIAENSPVNIEYSAAREGQESDYEARLVPLPEKQIVVIIRNITERKQSLRLLAAAVEQSAESITITDTEMDLPGPRILFVNPAFTKMTGYSAEDVLGQTPRILHGPKTERAVMQRLRDTLARGETFKGETFNYRKDGTEFNLEWEVTPIRNSSGLITHFLGIQRDITARKQAAALLIENRQRLALATESAHIGIWDWAVASDKMVWDPQMYALYGIRDLDFNGTFEAWKNSLHQDDRKRAESEIDGALRGVVDFDSEFRVAWPNGEVRDIEAHGVVHRAADGSPSRMIGVNWDITERKRTENSLRDSNEKFRQLADNITDVFWIISPDSNTVHYVSPAYERIWGRSIESLRNDPSQWAGAILAEDRGRVLADFARLGGDTASVAVEYRIMRPDGEIRWVDVRGFQVRSAANQLISLTGIVTDISERKRTELELAQTHLALHQAEVKYRSIFEHSSEGIFQTTPAGRYLSANPALARILGFDSPDELIRDRTDIAHQGYADPAVREKFKRLLEEHGTINDFEYEFRRKDGTVIWISENARIVRDPSGHTMYYEGSYHDITERKRAEETLRQSEERFSGAFEYASMGVALVSRGGRWLKVNQALCDLVGYSKAELLASNFQDITHPDDLAGDLEHVRRILAGEIRAFRMEKRYIHARGHFVPVLINVSLVSDAQGIPQYFISQIQDITERKISEAALEKAHQELVEASRMAGMAEFATGILHNVGNVLNSVNVASTCVADSLRKSKSANLAKVVALLQEHEQDLGGFFTNNPKGRQVPAYLAQLAGHLAGEQAGALKELAQLQRNIEHIRDIVTIQQRRAKKSGQMETVNVTELVADALRMSGVARTDMTVQSESKDVPPVLAEKHQALQILVNLIRNAQQACEGANQPEKKLRIQTTVERGHVRIAISDTGVGISPENLARIFSHGFTTKKDGHGFGLHSAIAAAKEMNGSLTAHSAGPGHGATFILELPCAPELSIDPIAFVSRP